MVPCEQNSSPFARHPASGNVNNTGLFAQILPVFWMRGDSLSCPLWFGPAFKTLLFVKNCSNDCKRKLLNGRRRDSQVGTDHSGRSGTCSHWAYSVEIERFDLPNKEMKCIQWLIDWTRNRDTRMRFESALIQHSCSGAEIQRFKPLWDKIIGYSFLLS